MNKKHLFFTLILSALSIQNSFGMEIVDDCDLDFSGPQQEETPLNDAIMAGNLEKVKELVSGGADIKAYNQKGLGPLHLAALLGHLSIVQYLVEYCKADVNARCKYMGWTPLFYASVSGNSGVCRFLKKNGANILLKNSAGETTCIDYARTIPLSTYLKSLGKCNKLEDQTKCPICFDAFVTNAKEDDIAVLLCGHCFHRNCINGWTQDSCPICRQQNNTDEKKVFCGYEEVKPAENKKVIEEKPKEKESDNNSDNNKDDVKMTNKKDDKKQ